MSRADPSSRRAVTLMERLIGTGDEELALVATSLLVGLAAAAASIVFRYLIGAFDHVGYDLVPIWMAGSGRAYVVAVPAVGGLLVGWMVTRYAPEARGHGVPEVMDAIARRGGRIRPAVVVIKSLASSISIGSGGSVGREGPIVQIGSAIGSVLGQRLHLSTERISNLVACGAAAGIAATFNAPIAGVIFALEVILGGRFSVRYFSSVVIAAVSASVVGRIAFGDSPAFHIPFEYGINSLWEFALYPVLGCLAGAAAVLFVHVLYRTEDLFESWSALPAWAKPAVGGALLGGLALLYPMVTGVDWDRTPQVFNVGYDVIEQALSNELSLSVLAALFVLKILATSLTLGSGGSGGVFAPSLFMGAMLGGAFQHVAEMLFPGMPAPAGAYALVGMAAMFAAGAQAPISAILILFELTGDYRIVLPLMLTSVVATLVAGRLLGGESIYTMKLERRGVRLRAGREADILSRVRVDEVMAHDTEAIAETRAIGELRELLSRRRKTGMLVRDAQGRLAGIVTLTDIERAEVDGLTPEQEVGRIATPRERLEVAYPDESMGDALQRMGGRGLGRLPVVSRDDPANVLGLVTRADIIRAYQLGAARSGVPPTRTNGPRFEDADFVELTLEPDDLAAGRRVVEIASRLPRDSVIVAIDRNGSLLIPNGDTELRAGDYLTAFARRQEAQALIEALRGSPTPGPNAPTPRRHRETGTEGE